LVFDIETVPLDFDSSFDDVQKEYLLRGLEDEEEIERQKGYGALNPLLGKCITIGLYSIERKYGAALYLASEELDETIPLDDMKLRYRAFTDERQLLEQFWNALKENISS